MCVLIVTQESRKLNSERKWASYRWKFWEKLFRSIKTTEYKFFEDDSAQMNINQGFYWIKFKIDLWIKVEKK